MLSGYYIMRLLEAAGLPPGVINFVPGDAVEISNVAAGLTATWPASTSPAARRCSKAMWTDAWAQNDRHATAPIRGWSARPAARTSSSRIRRPTSQELAVAIARGGFEYQGQKCSAASRVYVPAVALAGRCATASSR